jgi:hypothetical protein
MFGQQNDQQNDDNNIPASSIDGAINDQVAAPQTDWQHPGPPPSGDDASDSPAPSAPPSQTGELVVEPTAHHDSPAPTAEPTAPSTPADLADIKQKALGQLSPLVGHLDQTPEEKFRTTMMMIQASDDQSLVKVAYEAAQQITDEKAKAQALLDIVNEINYFTQNHSK